MSSLDVLLALRTAIRKQEAISYAKDGSPTSSLADATHITLSSGSTFAKSAPTRWRRQQDASATDTQLPMDPTLEPHRFFALDVIVLAWVARNDNGAIYMRQATTTVQNYVSLTERRSVVDWLEGKISDHERLAPPPGSTTPKTPPPSTSVLPSISPSKPDGISATPRTGGLKRTYIPDAADLEAVKKIRANEIELKDRNTVLRGVKTNNFSQIKDFVVQLKSAAKGGKGSQSSAAAAAPTGTKPGNKKSRSFPIIMVSSSPTALLTLHNIKKFLEESVYEPSEVARQRNGGKTEDMIAIYRKRTHIGPGGKETETRLKYFAVDGTEALAKFSDHGSDPWERVVCVMTTGQEWQFKPYKWTEPRQLFHNVKGVYFQWTNDPPNPRTKDWNVSELKIDQFKRHVDKSVVATFWRLLDTWMTTHKPSLLL